MNRGYLYLVITFFFWGSLYVATKFAMTCIPPWTLMFFRQGIAAVILGVVAWRKGLRRIPKAHWGYFLIIGVLGYFLSTNLQTLSTHVMNASAASLVNSLNPIFISVFAVLLLGESMTLNKGIGILCSLAGVFLVIGIDTEGINLLGVILSVSAVTLWSFSSVLMRKVSADYNSVQVTFVGFALAVPFCLGASVIELQSQPIVWEWKAVVAMLILAIPCTALTNLIWGLSLKMLDASICAQFYPLQVVFASALSIVILHEQISLNFILGGILISIGVIIGLRTRKPAVACSGQKEIE